MSKISQLSRSFLALTAFLIILAIGAPSVAHASVTIPTDPCADQSASGFNGTYQNGLGQAGYTKTNAATQVMGLFGAIDVKAQYCWSQIQSLFESIGNLSATSLNPFAVIVGAIISAVASQILNLISNACSAIMSTIQAFKSFLLSQLNNMCIPLPDLSLGLGKIAGLSFSNAKPCGPGSVPAFQFGYTGAGTTTPGNYHNFYK